MNLQVGVKALIQNESNQYLFMRRAVAFDTEMEPHWDIPGGRINSEEALLDALNREIMEETGLKPESEPTLLAAQDIFAAHAKLHVVRLTYHMMGTSEIRLSSEHQEVRWMTKHEALKSNLDPYTRSVIVNQKSA